MRLRILLLLLFCNSAIYAQSFIYPVLNPQGKTIKTLLPSQWKVIDSVSGDLNNDHVDDLALIIEFYAAVKENRAYGDASTELITEIQRPRILAIYFKAGKQYRLATQNNNFILRAQEGGAMGDPLRPISIKDNKLNFTFEGGGDWKWKLNYSFKYQNKDWQLTNANNYAYHRESGEMNDRQYDFLNRKRTEIKGTINDSASKNTSTEKQLSLKAMRTFSDFKKPWTWEIGTDEYL